MSKYVDFLFEANVLKNIRRSGWDLLGAKGESVAEHSYIVCVIGFILAKKLKADVLKVLEIGLFHDFYETRTGDLNLVNKLYLKREEKHAWADIFGQQDFGQEIIGLLEEYQRLNSLEAKIVDDADNLSLLVTLKILLEKNEMVDEIKIWFQNAKSLLHTKLAKEMASEIESANSHDWWKDLKARIKKIRISQKVRLI